MIIAEGSINQAAKGNHYSKALSLHRQPLECSLRFRSEKIIATLSVDAIEKVKNIWLHPLP